jgi:hypothetical protein
MGDGPVDAVDVVDNGVEVDVTVGALSSASFVPPKKESTR